MELTGQPVQEQAPKEFIFNHENLSKEVEKMITKQAITSVGCKRLPLPTVRCLKERWGGPDQYSI